MSPGSVPTERLPSEAELPLQLLRPAPIVIAARADAPRAVPLGGGRALPLAVLEEPAGA